MILQKVIISAELSFDGAENYIRFLIENGFSVDAAQDGKRWHSAALDCNNRDDLQRLDASDARPVEW